jgi:tetratricopeptide (TPR) repeat protein
LQAQVERSLGHFDEGLRCCAEGKARIPKDAELWFEEALLHQAKNDYAAAQRCYEQILELPPKPCFVGMDAGLLGHITRHHLALLHRDQKRPAEAEAQWRAATQECPQFGQGWLGLAELCLEQKRTADVERMIDELTSRPEAGHIVPVLRARLFQDRSDYGAACQVMKEAVARSPRSIWLRSFLSDLLLRQGNDLGEAENHLREILRIDPKHKAARQRFQQVQQRRKDKALAPGMA